MNDIIYYDTEKQVGLSVTHNEFRGKTYIHMSVKIYDWDDDRWYRTKGLSVTADYLDYLLEGLEKVEHDLAKLNLPDVRQLEFSFMKDKYDKK